MGYIYLASPYSDPDPDIRETRYEAVCMKCSDLLHKRIWVYSPIVHCHDIALRFGLPYDYNFWAGYNQAMIESCSFLAVFTIQGWETSKGVTNEIGYASHLGKTVEFWK